MDTQRNESEFKQMSLGDHLEELRLRLFLSILAIILGLVICLFFGGYLLKVIEMPYQYAMSKSGQQETLTAIQPAEVFLVYLKTCLIFGLILSSPWVFYQVWAFVSAGLYKHERRFVYIVVPASTILFVSGAIFFIKVVGPMAMLFFVKFNPGITVRNTWTMKHYVDLILMLTLVFGLAFQMPIVIVALEKTGLVSLALFAKIRKFVIVVLVIAAAMLTPPDVVSQVMLAVPLYVLFEGSLLFCWLTRRKKSKQD